MKNIRFTLTALSISYASSFVQCAFQTNGGIPQLRISSLSRTSPLMASLKPAAVPLMDAGKALARSGELLIDFTSTIDQYGGGMSSAGASMRNSGDYVAQAAASMRQVNLCFALRNYMISLFAIFIFVNAKYSHRI